MRNLVNVILQEATADVRYESFKHNTRQRLRTGIVLMKKEDLLSSKYLYKKVDQLNFWNEISGWFHSNADHKIYDLAEGGIEIPPDLSVTRKILDSSSLHGYFAVAGDHIVDEDYNVYVIYGWNNSDSGSEIYFDFV